ncbi:PREDICTED: uncharacterized protein LOC108564717 [Nicrophorus vespilloides]|uniref:Uncharacterized protein LOC108564717 n=1 Tax=Nicrophorus vespilloides TaxID=110193 RepID=A0ABM1MXK5_NICVS|nr:PREDICTED: uncharacterized protein LOC108564717 [Nicrophorus vespilloides]
MTLEQVQEIVRKYGGEEAKIEKLLQEKELEEKTAKEKKLSMVESKTRTSFDEIVKRNRQILKDLEVVKGNLRSKAIFSPSEMQWERICENYRENPSLPVTTYRCHLPVFV